MTVQRFFCFLAFSLLFLSACDDTTDTVAPTPFPTNTIEPTVTEAVATAVPDPIDTPEPTLTIATDGILISELLVGVPGGNSREFVELYNAGETAVNLQNWSLIYQFNPNQDPVIVYEWNEPAIVPPFGHYLLIHEGQEFAVLPDATFSQSLFEQYGGLQLVNAEETIVDRVGWGDAPEAFFAESPAVVPSDGASLERLPGGVDGHNVVGSNADSFALLPEPNPQNSGSTITPLPSNRLTVEVVAPESVEPGATFTLEVRVSNLADVPANNVQVRLPLNPQFAVLETAEATILEETLWQWSLQTLASNETQQASLTLQAPFTYVDWLVAGYSASADEMLTIFGTSQQVRMAGGSIPIGTARGLEGDTVTVEGVATMYTGGFFAGSSGTKFYIEDETGGIQVYVPGGNGALDIQVGDKVQVTGYIEIFRDAIEVVPFDFATDVVVLEQVDALSPTEIDLTQNEADDTALGRLNVVQGLATRVEEFSFSYEIDLVDEMEQTTTILIEKQTGVTAESLAVGEEYRVVGITEIDSGRRSLKPRFAEDIQQIYPPILRLEIDGPLVVTPSGTLTYTITAFNHTPELVSNVVITAVRNTPVSVQSASNDGLIFARSVVWFVGDLEAESSIDLTFTVTGTDEGIIWLGATELTASPDWQVETRSFLTFVGDKIPIWAIQGPGDTSRYVGREVTTEGQVTAVFPELGGFWIQESESDDSDLTSAGLFVLADDPQVAQADVVRVTGVVRELSGQTTLAATSNEAIVRLSGGVGLPAAVTYDPPADPVEAELYNESLEGMLVRVAETAVVIAPTTQYGESVAVLEKWEVDTLSRLQDAGYVIYLDDGSSVAHQNQSSLPYALSRGDTFNGVVGPLAYTFGNYKIEPIIYPNVTPAEASVPTFEPPANSFNIATFNVENLFDLVDPHPSSPPRPSLDEYHTKLDKIAASIVAMGAPQVIGLQEVENEAVLQDLLEREALADYGYVPYLVEGSDSRGIDVGYLVRDVNVIDVIQAPNESLMSRPPLVLVLDYNGQTFVIVNAHLTSLSAGEAQTEPVRTAQAQFAVDSAQEVALSYPDAAVVVLGDLNSFYNSLPLTTIEAEGFSHAYRYLPQDELPYTYIFEGRTQTLDHILVSDNFFDNIVAVTALHLNTSYPIAELEDVSPRRTSDHDPLIVSFIWQ